MTELFDGDGTSAQAQNAREHLKSCSSCERVWREWDRTRSLLRAVPTPVAPSALLERVVLSCRLLPAQDATAQAALENEIAHEELARYINAPDAEYSHAAASSPLACFFEDAPVPAGLKTQILQLTVEAANNRAKTPVSSLASFWLVEGSVSRARETWSGMAPQWSLPRAGRLGFALAVPAMAVWIFMAAPQRDLTVVPSATQPTPTIAATIFPQNLLPKVAKKIPVPKSAVKSASVVANRPPAETGSVSAAKERSVITSMASDMATMTSGVISQVTPQLLGFSASKSPSPVIPSPPVTEKKPVIKKPVITVAIRPRTPVATPKRKAPMISRVRSSQPRPLQVSLSGRAQLLAESLLKRLPGDADRQVLPVENLEPRITSPTLIASSTFDETLASVGRLRDDRPEELGLAVDTYRASLIAQDTTDEYSDEDFDE